MTRPRGKEGRGGEAEQGPEEEQEAGETGGRKRPRRGEDPAAAPLRLAAPRQAPRPPVLFSLSADGRGSTYVLGQLTRVGTGVTEVPGEKPCGWARGLLGALPCLRLPPAWSLVLGGGEVGRRGGLHPAGTPRPALRSSRLRSGGEAWSSLSLSVVMVTVTGDRECDVGSSFRLRLPSFHGHCAWPFSRPVSWGRHGVQTVLPGPLAAE